MFHSVNKFLGKEIGVCVFLREPLFFLLCVSLSFALFLRLAVMCGSLVFKGNDFSSMSGELTVVAVFKKQNERRGRFYFIF